MIFQNFNRRWGNSRFNPEANSLPPARNPGPKNQEQLELCIPMPCRKLWQTQSTGLKFRPGHLQPVALEAAGPFGKHRVGRSGHYYKRRRTAPPNKPRNKRPAHVGFRTLARFTNDPKPLAVFYLERGGRQQAVELRICNLSNYR